MNISRTRRLVSNRKWLIEEITKCENEDRILCDFKTYSCSPILRGELTANRNIEIYHKRYDKNIKRYNLLSKYYDIAKEKQNTI